MEPEIVALIDVVQPTVVAADTSPDDRTMLETTAVYTSDVVDLVRAGSR